MTGRKGNALTKDLRLYRTQSQELLSGMLSGVVLGLSVMFRCCAKKAKHIVIFAHHTVAHRCILFQNRTVFWGFLQGRTKRGAEYRWGYDEG